MATTNNMATLCTKCQSIFEGEWMEKPNAELESDSSSISGAKEIHAGETDTAIHSDSEDDSTTDSYFYESPDWVKKSDTNPGTNDEENSNSFTSPQHHSVPDLKLSSDSGCDLCTLLNDIVLGRVDEIDEADIPRAMGIVIVRPAPELSELQESIVLALSYFLDGELKQDAYLFGIEIILIPKPDAYTGRSCSSFNIAINAKCAQVSSQILD